MTPSETIQALCRKAHGFFDEARDGPDADRLHFIWQSVGAILDVLDMSRVRLDRLEQEQSSHAAKGSTDCDFVSTAWEAPFGYRTGAPYCVAHSRDAIECLREAKAEQHGGGRAERLPQFPIVDHFKAGEPDPIADRDAFLAEHPEERTVYDKPAPSKSPAPDADGGEEDGAQLRYVRPAHEDGGVEEFARRIHEEARVHFNLVAWEKLGQTSKEKKMFEATMARDLGRQESAEALGRAEANRQEWIATCERAAEQAERAIEERNAATIRAEKAEARLAAWEPVVRAAIVYCGPQLESFEAAHAEASALEAAVEALPAEHRPERPKTGGSGG